MTAPGVLFEAAAGVGRICLNRPEASNSVDLDTARALGRAVTAAAADDVKAVLLVGAGKRFCAGGDVRSFVDAAQPSAYLHELASVLGSELGRLADLPKPVVAGVHGAVAGAGLAFVLHADIVVAGRSTKFLMAYAGVGLTPDCGVSYLLPRAVGLQRALDLALTGRVLTAEEALDWGLVTEVVDDDVVHERAAELAGRLASGPAHALGQAKRLIRSSYEVTRERSVADEASTIAAAVSTEEAQRLVGQFISK
ncbi:enoyl-CoA hydratase/isomerase family protein [Dactylosporangium sp. CA-139066]|uniref:enoyl-CoA hydratase/isomerase family protein n=1 Tax=Dactylosporangium sp. CA-139066 TaxID=3239930 RepID=UPI003D8C7D4C